VTRRNVNPGNNVQAGQGLMALRSLTEIWVDANFKETQLANLRIGQRVELEVDMYGGRRTFEGRVSGFTMGTGSTLSLLPAQNATGNFIKVVQRLPVRIEVVDYKPDEQPLFVGLSVVPYVDIKHPPTGTDAGKLLQPYFFAASPSSPSRAAGVAAATSDSASDSAPDNAVDGSVKNPSAANEAQP
jgi:membrane fusion protein (multidrug efflux system)